MRTPEAVAEEIVDLLEETHRNERAGVLAKLLRARDAEVMEEAAWSVGTHMYTDEYSNALFARARQIREGK